MVKQHESGERLSSLTGGCLVYQIQGEHTRQRGVEELILTVKTVKLLAKRCLAAQPSASKASGSEACCITLTGICVSIIHALSSLEVRRTSTPNAAVFVLQQL